MIAIFKSTFLQFGKYLTTTISFLWELLQLSKFLLEGKRTKRFLLSSVNAEIRVLKKSNKKYQGYKYNLYQRIIDWIERHKIITTLCVLSLLAGSYYLNKKLGIWHIEKSNDVGEFQRFAATIQVTLFAVVVPFSTAILEFVFKDYQSKIDLIRLVHKETKVLFLTINSIMLTIVLFVSEYLSGIFNFSTNIVAVSITTFWLIINTIGMGYFIIVGLQFLTPYYRYRAITKYVANEVYPNELKNYVRRNAYLGLGNLNNDKDDNE